MKPKKFFGLALLFPYLLWGVCALVFFLLSSKELSDTWNIVLMPIAFYTFGIILWLIPYTILAGSMWIWSRNKSTTTLYKVAMFAPILFFALMFIEVVLVSLPTQNAAELTKDLPGQMGALGGFSLFFGYLCVGVAMGLFKFLKSKNFIQEETVINIEPPLSES
jgi:hypothetical protein